ncbi:MAG: helix-turn-helix transcriptional regulator [Burkholderiaceae bacterium]
MGHPGWVPAIVWCRCTENRELWAHALRHSAQRRALIWVDGLRANLMPLHIPGADDTHDETRLRAVFVTCDEHAVGMLRDLSATLQLTPAEREVLKRLMVGDSPGAIAEARHVKLSTVRSQVRGILTKAGVGSIRELITMLAALPVVND